MPKSYKFLTGCLWEDNPWEILINHHVEYPAEMCPHCRAADDLDDQGRPMVFCPRVVKATNEGGFNSTGICLDCILDAAKTLGSQLPQDVNAV